MELEDSSTLGGSCRSFLVFVLFGGLGVSLASGLVGFPCLMSFGCFGFLLQARCGGTLEGKTTKIQKRWF